MARCEDYPACGHTDGLPCDWVAPDYTQYSVRAAEHIGCDHNAGYCEYEEDEDDYEEGDDNGPPYGSEENEDADFDVEDYDERIARQDPLNRYDEDGWNYERLE